MSTRLPTSGNGYNDGNGSDGNGTGERYGVDRLFGQANGKSGNGHANGNGSDYNGNGHGPVAAIKKSSLWDAMGKPDSAALHALIAASIWFVIGTTLGLMMSHELTSPELFAGYSWLSFGRLRPTHINVMLFGFLSMALYGGWYYIVPRLTQTQLRSDRQANVLLALWNLGATLGFIGILAGYNKGHEYAELPMPACWAILALMVWQFSIMFSTIAARREPKLYVSLWYIGGTVIWIPIMFAIGNVVWHPFTTHLADGQIQYTGALFGMNDAVWNWFYGHNVFGLYITTGGVAIAYYMVPKITKRPLYSHTLSLIGFWTIALSYSPTGQHHLLQTPIPQWLKVLAIIGSIALFVPVFTFSVNLFMTMRGAWGMMLTNIPLRFLLTGSFFYLAVSGQGSVQSLMVVNRLIHYTQWTVAHAHLALLGAFGFISSAAMLWMVPQILRKPLWSRNWADAQFWLMLLGMNGYFWDLTAAGLAQSSAWVSLGQQVVRAYVILKPYFYLRTIFGTMIWVAAIMMMINLIMTWLSKAPDEQTRHAQLFADIEEQPRDDIAATVNGYPVMGKMEAN